MEINQSIFNQAKCILTNKVRLQEYIDTCIKARICPKCGTIDLKMCDDFYYRCSNPNCDWSQDLYCD